MTLSKDHLAALHASAISDEVIQARGYRTITDPGELRELGFAPAQCRTPGVLLPLWTTDCGNGLYVYRPDSPRTVEKQSEHNPDGTHPCKIIKYEQPKGAGIRLDCPPLCRPLLADPSIALWVTEGQKKADALASAGLCAIALLGVWNFKGKNEFGASTFLADWDYIALQDREVRIVFDSDVMTKREVQQALARLNQHLQRKGANVTAVYLPHGDNGKKLGVDDWLAAGHTRSELERLVDAPRPLPQPAPAVVELLDSAPLIMARPLVLLKGQAYAATWLYAKTTRRESLNKQREIIRHNPPVVTTERRLFIVRDDGLIFGEGGDRPLGALGIDLHLSEIPPNDRLWSTQAVKSFASGTRPVPAEIFNRIVDVVNRFIDFDRSLADQRTMSELVACYILSTWMLDAFSVVGFLWPNGDRGCGKTHLLIVVTELAYLGQLILAGGSFASLRDLADYGATLGFDDAENMSDTKRSDPDKRALLLAGNRRGVTIPLKELAADKTWHTRHVNAFCPRLFSATRLPDPILSSRTIVIPLIRTADRQRANTDPMEYAAWPHDRQSIVDDLWSLALANLSKLPDFDAWVGDNAKLAGRALQPWRGVLAVAAWLDQNGLAGVWERMEALSMNYQNERPDLETFDITALTIRALIDCAVSNVTNLSNVTNAVETPTLFEFTTSQIAQAAVALANDSDGEIDPDKLNSQRIGHVLKKMRLLKPTRPRGQKSRIWRVTRGELVKWALAYGLSVPKEIDPDKNIPYTLPDIGYIGTIGNIGYALEDDATPQPDELDVLEGDA